MKLVRKLARDEDGVTLVEFAFVAPILFVFIFGVLDIGHGLYLQSVLQGAVQDAGRDAGLEGGRNSLAAIDESVLDSVQAVMPFVEEEDVDIERLNYENFSDLGTPEDFDDSNRNDTYDDTECFTDRNGNAQWDPDVGVDGLGGADDIVRYDVRVRYDRLLPLWHMLGLPHRGTARATTVMRNQPFGQQASRVAVQVCP